MKLVWTLFAISTLTTSVAYVYGTYVDRQLLLINAGTITARTLPMKPIGFERRKSRFDFLQGRVQVWRHGQRLWRDVPREARQDEETSLGKIYGGMLEADYEISPGFPGHLDLLRMELLISSYKNYEAFTDYYGKVLIEGRQAIPLYERGQVSEATLFGGLWLSIALLIFNVVAHIIRWIRFGKVL